MSGLIKNFFRLPFVRSTKGILKPQFPIDSAKMPVRNLCYVSSHYYKNQRLKNLERCGNECSCNHSARLHTTGGLNQNKASAPQWAGQNLTQGEKELAEFLTEEIATEKKLQKQKKIPLELNGFTVKLDGSEVLMRKQDGDESIEITFNINHSVDSEDPEVDPSADKPELGEMKSRPNFEVEVKRGGKTVGFTCSIIGSNPPEQSQEYNDIFTIDEIVMYEGEWKDSNYSVAGQVIDGTLYDLLMNFLEDKGVTNEFVEKLMDFSTAYEHSCYINLLEDLQKFSQGK